LPAHSPNPGQENPPVTRLQTAFGGLTRGFTVRGSFAGLTRAFTVWGFFAGLTRGVGGGLCRWGDAVHSGDGLAEGVGGLDWRVEASR
jgi:hypothetical protein